MGGTQEGEAESRNRRDREASIRKSRRSKGAREKEAREENKRAGQGREGNKQREREGKGGRQQREDAGQRDLAEDSMWRHRCYGQLKSESYYIDVCGQLKSDIGVVAS